MKKGKIAVFGKAKIFWRFLCKWVSLILVGIFFIIINDHFDWKSIEDEKTLLIMSLGLVSIVTAITNFLVYSTTDKYEKGEYYLGVNIRRRKYYDSFWLNAFNNVPTNLFFWVIAIIPVIVLIPQINIENIIISEISNIVINHKDLLKSIWGSFFIVISFFCMAVFIESIKLSKYSFSRKELYTIKHDPIDEETIIKKIANEYQIKYQEKINYWKILIEYKNLRKINKDFELTSYIDKGKEICGTNNKEFKTYCYLILNKEYEVIHNIITKININKNKNSLKSFSKKSIKFLKNYYMSKWNEINENIDNKTIPAFCAFLAAMYDIFNIYILEKNTDVCKEYTENFWGRNINPLILDFYKAPLDNIVVEHISNTIIKVFENPLFYEEIQTIDYSYIENICMYLKEIDINKKRINSLKQQESEDIQDTEHIERVQQYNDGIKYSDRVMSALIVAITKENCNENVKPLKEHLYKDYNRNNTLHDIIQEQCFNRMISGDKINTNALKFLIQFLDFERTVAALLFVVSYRQRSYEKVMDLEEYRTWKDCLQRYLYKDNNKIDNKSIETICKYLEHSWVSHFMTDKLITWILKSLGKLRLDDEMYNEFSKRACRGFSFDVFEIIRMIFGCRDLSNIYKLTNQNEIVDRLVDIRDIIIDEGMESIFRV